MENSTSAGAARRRDERPRLLDLVRRVPELLQRLVRDEIAAARAEVARKAKAMGVGIGLAAAGAVLLLYGLGSLIGAATEALHLVLPAWLASLVVGGTLLAIAGVLAALGVRLLKRGAPPVPSETAENVRDDLRAMRGTRV